MSNRPQAPLGQEPWKRSPDGRFTVFRKYSLVGGGSPRGVIAPSRYSIHDRHTGKTYHLDNVAEINSFIHHRLTGEETAPWFVCRPATAPKAILIDISDD